MNARMILEELIYETEFDIDAYYHCPKCNTDAMIQDWDCLGAEPGNLFCPSCGAEVEPQETAAQQRRRQHSIQLELFK